jgi:hypothetical protein
MLTKEVALLKNINIKKNFVAKVVLVDFDGFVRTKNIKQKYLLITVIRLFL